MKKLLVMALLLSTMIIGNAVMAEMKVAVVDVQALVNNSQQVKNLKQEQQAKMKELKTWLKSVREDVNKQQTKEEKAKLARKYDADFAKKRKAIREDYAKKLQAIDKSMTDAIINEAKAKGYDLVLSKQGTVIYGGVDITSDLLKTVK